MTVNATKNISTIVLKEFTKGFMDDRVILNTVDNQILDGKLNPTTGDTVQFKRPHQYTAARTVGGDMTGVSNNIISATATATVADMITVRIPYSIVDEAIRLNQLAEIIRPAHAEMITTLEAELATYMIENAGLSNGTPAQSIDAWSDVAGTGSYLTALGLKGDRCAVMNPFSVQNLADAQGGLSSGNASLVTTAWEDAQISRNFGGLKGLMCDSLASYTTGDATAGTVDNTPVVTYSALKDTYQISIDLTGLGNTLTLKAGQQLAFTQTSMLNQQNKNTIIRNGSNIPWVGTVTADVTSNAGGEATVVLSGAPIFDATNPQYNTVDRAITAADTFSLVGSVDTTYQPGLFYTKGFVGVGSVDLPKLNGWDSSVISVDGYSIRVTNSSDPITNTQDVRFDLLPAFCCFNPLMGGQFFGNA